MMLLKKPALRAIAVLLLGVSSGCATLSSSLNARSDADKFAADDGFQKALISADPFVLTSYTRFKRPGGTLHVYIEGDGLAWRSRNRLSDDPTPRHLLVLTLASKDLSDNMAYLARPCQYAPAEPACDSIYWAEKRFSEEVIAAMDRAVDELKQRAGAQKVRLTGYSGGAAVAVLLAARRSDVVFLRTIAGSLDPEAVNRHHRVSPLSGSLDPMDVAAEVAAIPQEHLVGRKDKVVPPFIAENFVQKEGNPPTAKIVEVNADHWSGWAEIWPRNSRDRYR